MSSEVGVMVACAAGAVTSEGLDLVWSLVRYNGAAAMDFVNQDGVLLWVASAMSGTPPMVRSQSKTIVEHLAHIPVCRWKMYTTPGFMEVVVRTERLTILWRLALDNDVAQAMVRRPDVMGLAARCKRDNARLLAHVIRGVTVQSAAEIVNILHRPIVQGIMTTFDVLGTFGEGMHDRGLEIEALRRAFDQKCRDTARKALAIVTHLPFDLANHVVEFLYPHIK